MNEGFMLQYESKMIGLLYVIKTKGDGLDSRHAHRRYAIFYWSSYVVNLCSYGTSEVYSRSLYGLGPIILKFF